MINSVTLVGRLTKDPELKYTQNGVAVTRFTLAVNRTFSNQNGEREADFPNVVAYRKAAENSANYLKKGSLAGVVGRINTYSFDGQDGNRVFITEVVADTVQFLEPRSATEARENQNSGHQGNQAGTYGGNPGNNAGNNQNNYQRNQNSGQYGGGPSAYDDQGPGVHVKDEDLPF